jgi:hypothetical protein
MLEFQLNPLLRSLINDGIASWTGTPLPAGIVVQKAFQPRQAGVPIAPTITVHNKGTLPRGFPKFENFTDPDTQLLMIRERQRKESTYGVGALVLQNPLLTNQLTEVDVLEIVRFILQGQKTLDVLNPMDVGVLRITQVVSNYFIDDRGQNENNPTFDIIFTFTNEVVYPANSISGIDAGVYPILGS